MRRKIVAGNWKLHGSRDFATELVGKVAAGLPLEGVDVLVLPPLPYLGDLVEDFAAASNRLQGVLIHELTHVWQAQQGVNLLWAS